MARRNTETSQPRLETIVRVIAPIFLILSIFLISKKTITGNAINNLNFSGTVPIVVILIIALIFVIAAGIKGKR